MALPWVSPGVTAETRMSLKQQLQHENEPDLLWGRSWSWQSPGNKDTVWLLAITQGRRLSLVTLSSPHHRLQLGSALLHLGVHIHCMYFPGEL